MHFVYILFTFLGEIFIHFADGSYKSVFMCLTFYIGLYHILSLLLLFCVGLKLLIFSFFSGLMLIIDTLSIGLLFIIYLKITRHKHNFGE